MPFQHMNTENSIGRQRMANRILVTNAVLIAYTPWPASIAGMDKDDPNLKAPIVLAVLGAMSAAFVLTIYHCIMITCGNRRRTDQPEGFHAEEGNASSIEISTAQLIPPAYIYEKGKGTVDGEEGEIMCAVCLCEFKEGEAVRLLPKCKHYFHVPCIDRWISSHSSCPMCRTEMSPQHHQQYPEVLPPDLGRVPEFG